MRSTRNNHNDHCHTVLGNSWIMIWQDHVELTSVKSISSFLSTLENSLRRSSICSLFNKCDMTSKHTRDRRDRLENCFNEVIICGFIGDGGGALSRNCWNHGCCCTSVADRRVSTLRPKHFFMKSIASLVICWKSLVWYVGSGPFFTFRMISWPSVPVK